jgi:hypothetical protein
MDKRFFFEKYGISERDLEKYLSAGRAASTPTFISSI